MNIRFASHLRQQTVWLFNRVALGLRSVWTSIILVVREIPRRLSINIARQRRKATPRHVARQVALIALVVTPTILYVVEHERRSAEQEASAALQFTMESEARFLESSVRELLNEQSYLSGRLLAAGLTVRAGEQVTVKVIATGYSSTIQQTDSTPFITAANTRTRDGVLALSRDLLTRYTPDAPFTFGDRVHISGVGDFIVEDSMNKRWRNRADVWFPKRIDALRFGVREVTLSSTSDDEDYSQVEDEERVEEVVDDRSPETDDITEATGM